jgi:F-type H+-transporting ATPase subunit delta
VPANSATATGLATRYAAAVFDLAREQNKLDVVARDLDRFAAASGESDDLRRLISSPVLSREQLRVGVTAVAEQLEFDELVRNLLGVLATNRRLFAIGAITVAFRERLARERGEVQAEVVSARELEPSQKKELEESVRRFAGKEVHLKHSVEPALLGGLTVRIGSRMIDASLRTKLQQLELSMRGLG